MINKHTKIFLLLLLPLFSTPLMAKVTIELYNCYGSPYQMMISGRVLDTQEHNEQKPDDGWFKNSWHKLKHLINSEIKNEPITVTIGKLEKEAKTDDEGYFEFELFNTQKAWKNGQNVKLTLNQKDMLLNVSALILDETITKGIISDFDDTVIVSNVTHKLKLLNNTLFKNYKQRALVQEVAKKIKASEAPLFIVTGSPRQLQSSIDKFLDYHHFPERTIITKKAHGENSDPLFDQLSYKFSHIEELIELFPHIVWDCYGDSGEKDREVYLKLAKKYPDNIDNVCIRNVESGEISCK